MDVTLDPSFALKSVYCSPLNIILAALKSRQTLVNGDPVAVPTVVCRWMALLSKSSAYKVCPSLVDTTEPTYVEGLKEACK